MIARFRAPDTEAKPEPRQFIRRHRGSNAITIDQALTDSNLLGAALGDAGSWQLWRSVLRAAFGLPLDNADLERFHSVAGDRRPPEQRVDELWAVLGRRSGKTRVAAAVSVFIATLCEHRLAAGEVGYVLLLAASRSQASVAFNYVIGFLEASPILSQLIEGVTADEVRLTGNIVIAVHTNSYRTIRGRSLLAVIGDETSFWRDETSAAPDVETYRACVPALAEKAGIWVGISSGYRKTGLLYTKWRDHFGQAGDDVLVIQGPTQAFNPLFNKKTIDKAKAADPEAAESEWMGGFRNDIAAFLDDATIDAAIDFARPIELPPRDGVKYFAFADASGGRHDAYTVCVGHKEGERFVADVIRGKRPPFDPQTATAEYAKLLKEYRLSRITGDNYSAAWVETAWKVEGIKYERSKLPKSALYLEALPLFMRGLVSIPDHAALSRELRLLERRTARSSKDIVDHGRNGADDHANALAGMLNALNAKRGYDSTLSWVGGDDLDDNATFRVGRMRAYLFSGGMRR